MGTHIWEFRLSIQVCVGYSHQYSDSGIQVWNSDLCITGLGIQVS